MRRLVSLLALAACATAAAQAPAPRIAPVAKAGTPLIVQGGLAPPPGCEGAPGAASTGAVSIGPKQDDPAPRPSSTAGSGALAIGPKQDDPAPPPPQLAAKGARVAALAIGPKQDDPAPKPPAVRCTPASR